MPNFRLSVYDPATDRETYVSVQAESIEAAKAKARESGLTPLSGTEPTRQAGSATPGGVLRNDERAWLRNVSRTASLVFWVMLGQLALGVLMAIVAWWGG